MSHFKISTGITENLNKLTSDAREDKKPIRNFKNKFKGSILEYLKYYEDNSISEKNKGRTGLKCTFFSKVDGVKTTDDLIKYILKETKDIKFKESKNGKGGEQPISCWVTTFNDEAFQTGEIDGETYYNALNDWIKQEIKFLEDQGFEVLGYYEHEGEDTPHIHIVLKNWYDRDFTYTNQERNADGSKKEWKRTRRIAGSKGQRILREESKKQKKKDLSILKEKHYKHLQAWIKKYPKLKLNERGDETTIFAINHAPKDSLIYQAQQSKELSKELIKAILQVYPDAISSAGGLYTEQEMKEAIEALQAKDAEIKALKAENKRLTDKELEEIGKKLSKVLKPKK